MDKMEELKILIIYCLDIIDLSDDPELILEAHGALYELSEIYKEMIK